MAAPLRLVVVGAGIAGLAAAIALRDHPGIDVQVYERAVELREIGASIALGPNGMRTLDRLGVHNALDDDVAFRNKSGRPMIYRHYKTNEVVSVDEHHGHVELRHRTARFYRAHLQEALLAHVDPARIHLGKAFQSVGRDSNGGLVVTFTDSTTATADLLLGADGIHSAVRRFFVPTSAPVWTGAVAFRSVFPAALLAHISDLPDEAIHTWGPDRNLFLSPLGRGLFTVVGGHQAADPTASDARYRDAVWDTDADVEALRALYRDWSPLARAILDAVPHTRIFPNTAGRGVKSWVLDSNDTNAGRVTVAGDAAHAHGGAFAAGGSLAIDDAWAFSAAIQHVYPPGSSPPSEADIARALRLYEATRKAHTDRVLRTVHAGHAKKASVVRGPAETDEQLRARIRNREDPAWIHEHNVEEVFAGVVAQDSRKSTESQARL